MLFFDWWIVAVVLLAVIFLLAGVCGLRYASRISSRLLRLGISLAGVGSILLSSLFGLLSFPISGCRSNSAPIYSPSRTMAVRIESADEGATGGSSSVVLFRTHGLRQTTIYFGPIGSVETTDIHWIGNSELSIHYLSGFPSDEYRFATLPGVSVSYSPYIR